MSEYRDDVDALTERERVLDQMRVRCALLESDAIAAHRRNGELQEEIERFRKLERKRDWSERKSKLGAAALAGISSGIVIGIFLLMKACIAAIPPDPDLRSGWVVGRDYDAPYTTSHSNGNGGTTVTHHPADWDIYIADGDQITNVDVTEEVYDRAMMGSWWCENQSQTYRCVPPPPSSERE